MDSALTNRYHLDEAALRQSYRESAGKFLALQLILAVAILWMAVRDTVRSWNLFSQSVPLLLMVLFLYFLAGFEAYRALRFVDRTTKRVLQRLEERYGVREYDVTLRFEETELVSENSLGSTATHLAYDNIRKLTRGKALILMGTKARSTLILDPNGFENGTETDFWKLMKEKCPQAVPKKYRGG